MKITLGIPKHGLNLYKLQGNKFVWFIKKACIQVQVYDQPIPIQNMSKTHTRNMRRYAGCHALSSKSTHFKEKLFQGSVRIK
jgi:hypothetical protein